jgi:hypothetical protein
MTQIRILCFNHSGGLTCFRGTKMGVDTGMCLARTIRIVSENEVEGPVLKGVRGFYKHHLVPEISNFSVISD